MPLKGIDISSHQTNINLSQVPCDFVIVKVSQGTGYVNPAYEKQYNSAKSLGKKLGLYHYAAGGNATDEANLFLKHIGSRYNEAVLALDWESGENPAYGNGRNIGWVGVWMNTVERATGKKPLLYCSPYLIDYYSMYKDRIWAAQYASKKILFGYQEHPWNEGKYDCVIRQYSGRGRLVGFPNDLDLDKFYGEAADWDRLVGAKTTPTSAKSTLDLAYEALSKGLNGEARRNFLGDRYTEVQNFINHIYRSGTSDLVNEVMSGKYGNGDVRKVVLGDKYEEVQNAINSNKIPKVQVTGVLDEQTIRAWQKYLGVTTDGIIGRHTTAAIQRWAGVAADGIAGTQTRKAVQSKLGVTADGIWGKQTITALQNYLNAH